MVERGRLKRHRILRVTKAVEGHDRPQLKGHIKYNNSNSMYACRPFTNYDHYYGECVGKHA